MITNKQLAAFVAVGPVDTEHQCNAWMDSADRRCGKPCDDYLCPAHIKVARRRGEKAVAKELAQSAREKARILARYDLAALTAERDRILAQIDRVTGLRRHGTDDLAAYGGIGIRQTARQRRQYANRVDNALGEYTRLEKQLKIVEQRIQSARWARGETP